MTGTAIAALPHARQYTQPVEIGHHQIEDDAIDASALRAVEQRQRGIAVVAGLRLVAEFLQHAFEQAALHRIAVDNEDRHRYPGPRTTKRHCAVSGHCGDARLTGC
jgi:hypothetical protein